MDYENTKITSMHFLYPRRRDVAAHVAEELKPVTYTTPPIEERRKKSRRKKLTGIIRDSDFALEEGVRV